MSRQLAVETWILLKDTNYLIDIIVCLADKKNRKLRGLVTSLSSNTVHVKLLCNLCTSKVGVLCTCEGAVTLCLSCVDKSIICSECTCTSGDICAAEPLYLAMPNVFARVIEFM